jgi:hypothetical protein
MSVYLILDLVQTNRHLRKLRIKRKSFCQQMILSDTLFLEEIDVKLSPLVKYTMVRNKKVRYQAQLVMGENMALRTVKTNCAIELN